MPELRTSGSVRSRTGALQNAVLDSASFPIIANDEGGVIQLFIVGAERMPGHRANPARLPC